VTTVTISVPDIGGADDVEVIEICVVPGDRVELEQPLIVLESDKASMEIPSPFAGEVVAVLVEEGVSLSEGDAIITMILVDAESTSVESVSTDEVAELPPEVASEVISVPEQTPELASDSFSLVAEEQIVAVPDTGGADNVEVIEVCVAIGDEVEEGQSLVVVESDKASMEIPAPFAGTVTEVLLKEGDQAEEATPIIKMMVAGAALVPKLSAGAESEEATPGAIDVADKEEAVGERPGILPPIISPRSPVLKTDEKRSIYAGPAVRKLARELGVDLNRVKGSGPKSRLVKEDVQSFVQKVLNGASGGRVAGSGIPPIPDVDFSKFGDVDIQPLTKMHKLTAANLHRSWLNMPHVTQFDDADISDMEDFRQSMKADAERRGVKLTPLPFLLKACAAALLDNQALNVSLMSDGENIVFKKYINIGMAVATKAGLMVPVIKDVDKKNLWDLATETADLAQRAKDRKLRPDEMQGGCFTVSSLGNIGGTGFTPIINAPEVAILGVSKLMVKPMWDGESFQPRKMLPLSLSYDHRAINGADAGKFFTELGGMLADIRKLLL